MRSLLLLALVTSGCALHAQPLTELTLVHPPALDASLRTDKRILVVPFQDLRGTEYARTSPNSFVPVLNWFHSGQQTFYPEQAGMLRLDGAHGQAVTVGAIGTAMPSLIVDTLRKMGVSSCAVAGDGPDAIAPDFDYVVTGRVLKTRFKEDSSALLQLAFGVLGVPYRFAQYDLEYEISLYDNRDPSRPVFQHVYAASERLAQGLYYNHGFAYPMFVRGLERTLPEVALDLARLLAGRA